MTDGEMEALTRRATRLQHLWSGPFTELPPRHIIRLDLPRRITWLRIVHSKWLLVASYDDEFSTLTCWDISLVVRDSRLPMGEWYLPGPVKSGQIETQENGVVIALGVDSE